MTKKKKYTYIRKYQYKSFKRASPLFPQRRRHAALTLHLYIYIVKYTYKMKNTNKQCSREIYDSTCPIRGSLLSLAASTSLYSKLAHKCRLSFGTNFKDFYTYFLFLFFRESRRTINDKRENFRRIVKKKKKKNSSSYYHT